MRVKNYLIVTLFLLPALSHAKLKKNSYIFGQPKQHGFYETIGRRYTTEAQMMLHKAHAQQEAIEKENQATLLAAYEDRIENASNSLGLCLCSAMCTGALFELATESKTAITGAGFMIASALPLSLSVALGTLAIYYTGFAPNPTPKKPKEFSLDSSPDLTCIRKIYRKHL